MLIEVLAEKIETGEQKLFFMDNQTGAIRDHRFDPTPAVEPIDISTNNKAGKSFARIKIQLGLSCNYSCSYCSQRFVERPPETSKKDIDSFMAMFNALPKISAPRVEFWGGEPFVYWKTLKPLAERVKSEHPTASFLVITNGSLLTREIVDWLDVMGFDVAISHDGPGQHVRGDDPLDANKDAVYYAIEKLCPQNRISFNSCLNKQNPSRLRIIEFFAERFPGLSLSHGEMRLIDAHDEGGLESIDFSITEHFEIRRDMWAEARFQPIVLEKSISQRSLIEKVIHVNAPNAPESFINKWITTGAGMKCGMELPSMLALDLRGNIITCQNTSAAGISDNGESHKVGHVSDLEGVRMKTAKHWTMRPVCQSCPVLMMCHGSCMFLDGENWYKSCDAQFSNCSPLLAIAFEKVTGFVPIRFGGDNIPAHRQDIWGSIYDWSADPEKPKRKIIPIKAA